MTIVQSTRQHNIAPYSSVATEAISDIQERVGRHFSRSEPRKRFIAYLVGLLSEVQRKNGCSLAEFAQEIAPDGMQRLLTTAKWDVDAVRNELRSCVGEWFGDPRAIVVVNQAAFTKRGRHSAGVKQQYNEDSQRVENCQLGLFLGYATPHSTILVDRELYLPEEWHQDNERRSRARIPEVAFASRSALAIRMLGRAIDSELPMSWVSTSELADAGPALHEWLASRQVPHVVEIRASAPVHYERGSRLVSATARDLLQQASTRQWQQFWHSGRLWSRVLLRTDPTRDNGVWLVVQRMRDSRHDRYYVAAGPAGTTLGELARTAQAEIGVKTALNRAKDRVGLDHYEARRYEAWYRHVTLAMFADALLEAHGAPQHDAPPTPPQTAQPQTVLPRTAQPQTVLPQTVLPQTFQGARGRCPHYRTRQAAIMPAR
jgi:SRSO17 transposase